MIALARKTMVYEWRRFVPAVFAVGFSGLLLLVQAALVLGIFGSAALYVTASSADLWVGYPGTQSVNFGRSISPEVEMHLRMDPGISAVEPYLWVDGEWHNQQRSGGSVPVYVSGLRTSDDAMAFSKLLTPGLRQQLRAPGAVVVDRADLEQLGTPVGGQAWINGQPVQVLAAISGLRALGGINVVASLDTARSLQAVDAAAHESTYFLAQLRPSAATSAVQARLQGAPSFGRFEVWSAAAFARRSQLYWVLDTGAGIAVLFMATIVCLVGAVITSQSLLAVVAASEREYAMLNALGASLWSLSRVVLEQAGWIGGLGLLLGGASSGVLLWLAARNDVPVDMNWPVALACAALVSALSLLSGLIAVRALLRADPAMLLR